MGLCCVNAILEGGIANGLAAAYSILPDINTRGEILEQHSFSVKLVCAYYPAFVGGSEMNTGELCKERISPG